MFQFLTHVKLSRSMAAILEMPQYLAYLKNFVYAFIKLSAKSHSFNILRTMDGLSCPTIYCYLECKKCYLKNLKLFSIRVKELFEPIVLREKGNGFLFFLKAFFSRNRSLSNARWFYGKKRKIGKGNLYLTEDWLNRNENRCPSDNHNNLCHICAKRTFRFELFN